MPPVQQFALLSRVLHWLMAAMVIPMLFIGVGMVASLADYHALVAIHRPLGIAILILVVIRFVNRQLTPPPPFPPTLSSAERVVASWSERLLYALMFALPLVGWAMLSAARYPVVLYGPIHLPPILPVDPALYSVLRTTHTVLAYVLFFTFMAHLSAVLVHSLVMRDGLLNRMVPWTVRSADPPPPDDGKAVRYPVSIKGVVAIDGKVVLLKNDSDEWELPGGKLEAGEDPHVCVVREIEEELGLRTTVERILDAWLYDIHGRVEVLIVTYGCQLAASAQTNIVISEEHTEVGLFAADEIAALNMPEGYKRSIAAWLE
jgi:cytochrome b561